MLIYTYFNVASKQNILPEKRKGRFKKTLIEFSIKRKRGHIRVNFAYKWSETWNYAKKIMVM